MVIGSQSVGKTSLIEAIIGREFLPRGKGIVTRRPLELALTNLEPGQEEYAEFFEKKGEKITDFSELKRLIEQETDKIAGKSK